MLPYVFRMPILTHISTHQIYLVNKIYMLFLIKVSVPFLSIPCRNYLFFSILCGLLHSYSPEEFVILSDFIFPFEYLPYYSYYAA